MSHIKAKLANTADLLNQLTHDTPSTQDATRIPPAEISLEVSPAATDSLSPSVAPPPLSESVSKRHLDAGGAPAGTTGRQFTVPKYQGIAKPERVRGSDAWEASIAPFGLDPKALSFLRIGKNTVTESSSGKEVKWLFERSYEPSDFPSLIAIDAHLRQAWLAGFVTMALRDAGFALQGELAARPTVGGTPYWTGFIVSTGDGSQLALVLPLNATPDKSEPVLLTSGDVSKQQIESFLADVQRRVTPEILARFAEPPKDTDQTKPG